MREACEAAWQGWRSFSSQGKLAGALLAALLFLWIYYRAKRKEFLIYTTGVTLLCILPVSAAALMLYQTSFYDYKWIWSIVPVTAAVGFAAVLFLSETAGTRDQRGRRRRAAAALLLAVGLVFCGGMGVSPGTAFEKREEREQAQIVLNLLKERLRGQEICLLAPRGILGYARSYDAGITLLYGRDMWEPDLRSYSYDQYPEGLQEVYRWMEAAPWEKAPDIGCMAEAVSAGANCILISADKPEESVRSLEELLGVPAETLEGYYLFVL